MKLFLKLLVSLLVLVVVGAGAFLLTWDIPSPSAITTIVLPNDRFPS